MGLLVVVMLFDLQEVLFCDYFYDIGIWCLPHVADAVSCPCESVSQFIFQLSCHVKQFSLLWCEVFVDVYLSVFALDI